METLYPLCRHFSPALSSENICHTTSPAIRCLMRAVAASFLKNNLLAAVVKNQVELLEDTNPDVA
jgi:hypothetical protein